MQGFLDVCLLVLLTKEPGHGYGLIEGLNQFGFSDENLNISTLYKSLRKMEDDGFVVSSWEEGDQGPKKRIYQISSAGKDELADWVAFLKLRKQRISKLIDSYDEIISEAGEKT